MRPTILVLSRALESDGKFNVTEGQVRQLMEDSYNAGLEEGRNKALAEEYVKMTTLQMNIADVEEKE